MFTFKLLNGLFQLILKFWWNTDSKSTGNRLRTTDIFYNLFEFLVFGKRPYLRGVRRGKGSIRAKNKRDNIFYSFLVNYVSFL